MREMQAHFYERIKGDGLVTIFLFSRDVLKVIQVWVYRVKGSSGGVAPSVGWMTAGFAERRS